MKMVKSLLLGSAAGLVAVAGAQAADLPVKAKPVEYVKVCSLYGAGYYYMPGTDICLKLGGYVRYQATVGTTSLTVGPMNGLGGVWTRTASDDFGQRVRALITVDTRQQTAYGTLRTYTLLGYSQDTNGPAGAETTSPGVYMTRGFIQIAGFTLGKATSFFDIYPNASFGYNVGTMYVPDTGDAGKILATYTAQFGNGFSASIGIEQSRRASVVYTGPNAGGTNVFVLGAAPTNNSWGGAAPGVSGVPDVVGNVRLDQAWGSILAALALHDASGGYYGSNEGLGRPANKLGWAATIGAIFNLPMIAPGDRFAFQFVYSEGAIKYAAVTPGGGSMLHWSGGTMGFGFYSDAIYGGSVAAGTNTTMQLTTAWSLAAAFEHLWTPALRTSLYGSYIEVSHNATAVGLICASVVNAAVSGATNAIAPAGLAWGGAGCNPNWSSYVIGSRTQWSPTPGWIMGVDVLYSHLKSARTASGIVTLNAPNGALGGHPAGSAWAIADQSAWVFTFRTQRDYHP